MSLYAIADLHLCFSNPSKTMEIFAGWENYQERIRKNWLETVSDDDTVVIAGDISWGASLQQSLPDFRFINELSGHKIILKGNHDYWWVTMKKINDFLSAEQFSTINILHNNHYRYGRYGICGTRGWVNMPDEVQDEKILKREVNRLELSVQSALKDGLEPVVFMHYPPIFASSFNYDILDVFYRYNIKECFYGHIHGRSAHALAIKNTYDGINFHLVSGDYVQFIPQKVL